MAKPRRAVTSRLKPTDMFERRLVITVSRGGIITLTIATIASLRFAAPTVEAVIALVTSVVAIATTLEARHQLRTFRYEIVTRLNSTVAAYQIPDDDLRIAHELGLLDDDDEDEDDAPRIRFRPARQG